MTKLILISIMVGMALFAFGKAFWYHLEYRKAKKEYDELSEQYRQRIERYVKKYNEGWKELHDSAEKHK